jgi:hypothetical protein
LDFLDTIKKKLDAVKDGKVLVRIEKLKNSKVLTRFVELKNVKVLSMFTPPVPKFPWS